MDKFSSLRISQLAGVKFTPKLDITEEEMAKQFDELYDLLEQYESAELLEHIASLDLEQLDEGFWGNIKDAAKGALGVAKDAKDAVSQKIKDKAKQVSDSYSTHVEKAKNDRQSATASKLYSLMKSDITKYIAKIEQYCKKEFDGQVPPQAKGVMNALQTLITRNLKGVK